MKRYTQEVLNEVIRLHGLWRNGVSGGVRADLSGCDVSHLNLTHANLTGAKLTRANLWGCVGNSNEIKTMQTDGYTVTYTHARIQIGFGNHSIEEWRNFSHEEIARFDGKRALTFWKKWKSTIFQIIEMSPATATGYES